jgi:hypothetical protein
MELADIFTTGPPLEWFIGRVSSVEGATLTMTYRGGQVTGVAYVDQVTPVGGDEVHGLKWDTNGFIVLGTNNKPNAVIKAPELGDQVVFTAFSNATAGPLGWEPGVLHQAPTLRAAWFYQAPDVLTVTGDRSLLAGHPVAAVEIEVVRVSGGPPEFFAHNNGGPVGAPVIVGDRFVNGQPPVGVPTWVRLPVTWGELFVTGAVQGFGIGGGFYTGEWSGTGRLRVTALRTGR